jgi:hypothetical protein
LVSHSERTWNEGISDLSSKEENMGRTNGMRQNKMIQPGTGRHKKKRKNW